MMRAHGQRQQIQEPDGCRATEPAGRTQTMVGTSRPAWRVNVIPRAGRDHRWLKAARRRLAMLRHAAEQPPEIRLRGEVGRGASGTGEEQAEHHLWSRLHRLIWHPRCAAHQRAANITKHHHDFIPAPAAGEPTG